VVDTVAVETSVYDASEHIFQEHAGPYDRNILAVYDVVELGDKLEIAVGD
jgi:hypothetical protein